VTSVEEPPLLKVVVDRPPKGNVNSTCQNWTKDNIVGFSRWNVTSVEEPPLLKGYKRTAIGEL
jgi:hypothetical protein